MKNLLALCCVLASLLVFSASASAVDKESVYDRVIRTNTLRCGYNIWEPSMIQDPTTKKLSGAYIDYVNEMGKALGVKIEWIFADWGTFPEDIKTGKIDAMCAGVWADARRGRFLGWTTPPFYNRVDAFARADDTRFTPGHNESMNRKDATIAVFDGTTPQKLADMNFPDAHQLSLSSMASGAEGFMSVTQKKADIFFSDVGKFQEFTQKNPTARLRQISTTQAIGLYPQTIAMDIHEHDLKAMLDTATVELLNNGVIAKIVKKYDQQGAIFILPAAPVRGQ